MVFTDPPYNVAYEGGTDDKLTIKNDDMPAEEFSQFLKSAFTSMYTVTEPGGGIYVYHADSEGSNFRGSLQDAGWYGGRKQGTVIKEAAPFIVTNDEKGTLLTFTFGIQTVTIRVPSYEVLQAGDESLSIVWRFDKPLRNGDHPTMKPIGLCARTIQNSSRPGEFVLDLFGGSGSTLMAAEQAGRCCYTTSWTRCIVRLSSSGGRNVRDK